MTPAPTRRLTAIGAALLITSAWLALRTGSAAGHSPPEQTKMLLPEHSSQLASTVPAAARVADPGPAMDTAIAASRQVLPPTAPAEVDADWEHLRRTRYDLVHRFVLQPTAAEGAATLRSVTFNPRDLPLDAAARTRVIAAVDDARAGIDTAAGIYAAALDSGFAAAHASGAARVIDLVAFPGNLQLAPLGPSPFCRRIDGVDYAVSRDDMPEARRTRRELRRRGAELVSALARAFVDTGALTEHEAAEITAMALCLVDD